MRTSAALLVLLAGACLGAGLRDDNNDGQPTLSPSPLSSTSTGEVTNPSQVDTTSTSSDVTGSDIVGSGGDDQEKTVDAHKEPVASSASLSTVEPTPPQVPSFPVPSEKMMNIMNEIVITEKSYLFGLHALHETLRAIQFAPDKFVRSAAQHPAVQGSMRILPTLIMMSNKLYSAWEAAMQKNPVDPGDFAAVFNELEPLLSSVMAAYTSYNHDANIALSPITEHSKFKPLLDALYDDVKKSSIAFGLDKGFGASLLAMLITPIQRGPRYMMLFESLADKANSSHPSYDAVQALKQAGKHLARAINNDETERIDITNLEDLNTEFHAKVPIITPGRWIVRRGTLQVPGILRQSRLVVLLSDMLIIRNNGLGQLFGKLEYIPLTATDKAHIVSVGDSKITFKLANYKEFTVQATSPSDAAAWSEAFAEVVLHLAATQPDAIGTGGRSLGRYSPAPEHLSTSLQLMRSQAQGTTSVSA